MVINMKNTNAKCGWLIDASVKGKSMAFLNFLADSKDLSEVIKKEIENLITEFNKVECKFYEEV